MKRHGKRYQTAVKDRDPNQVFNLADAIKQVKEQANAKFDETGFEHIATQDPLEGDSATGEKGDVFVRGHELRVRKFLGDHVREAELLDAVLE